MSEDDAGAESSNGRIRVRVPADTAADLALRTVVGPATFGLSDFTVTNLEVAFNEVTATLNGGGGPICADTVNGSIDFGGL